LNGAGRSSGSPRDGVAGRLLDRSVRRRSGPGADRLAGAGRHALVKRAFDILAACVLLVAAGALLVLIAVAIKLDSRGPVFYRVRRVGYRGRPLLMLKFRKMHQNANGMPLTANADPRFTRVGTFLARTRLDELPQLWDVLRGRMSLVGPRPEDPGFVALHPEAYDRILSVRPGMTGLSQLAFAEEHNILDQDDLVGDYVERILPQKVGLDVLYAQAHRLGMDIAILGWTVAAMLMHKPVAVHRSTAALSVRRRPRRVGGDDGAAAARRREPAGVR
jgi:lipopolysaccharide/colanic/teichoic acid biosynthesis glycosyltransferase